MAQYDLGTIDTATTGTQLATKLGPSAWPQAVLTSFSGSAAQAYFLDGQIWVNTAGGATAYVLTYNKGAGVGTDIAIGTINRSTNVFTVAGIGTIVQAYDVDTAKTDVVQQWSRQQHFGEVVTTFVSGGTTWNLDLAPCTIMTMTGNMTGTMDASNLRAGSTVILNIVHSGAGRTISAWAAKFKFGAEGTPVLSTTAGARDILSFYVDGTSLHCTGRAFGF
jgi:hypothetical protein